MTAVFRLLVAAAVLLAVATVAVAYAAIWTSGDVSGRLGWTAFATFVVALVCTFGAVFVRIELTP